MNESLTDNANNDVHGASRHRHTRTHKMIICIYLLHNIIVLKVTNGFRAYIIDGEIALAIYFPVAEEKLHHSFLFIRTCTAYVFKSQNVT